MSNKWREISIEEARRHPLYGVGGWLVVFAILVAFEFVFRVLYYLGGVRELTSGAYWGVLGFLFLSILVIYWLLLTKHHFFRHIVSALYVIYLLLLDYNFYYWIVPYAIWIIYLQKSKRVRVTYEHCVVQGSFQNDPNLQMETLATMNQVKQPDLNTRLNNHSNSATSTNIEKVTKQEPTIPVTTQTTPMPSSNMDSSLSEEFWAAAYAEFKSSKRRIGLWARTYAEANGNEAVAKAAYLSLRVGEMQSVEIKREQDLKAAEEERNYQLIPKGRCSNEYCEAIIPLTSINCPKCNAGFGTRYGWSIKPIEQGMSMTDEEINHSKQLKCICSYCKKALLSPTAISCHKCNTTFTASSASFRLIPIDLQIQEEVLSKAIQLRKSFTEFEVDMLSKAIKN